MPETIHTPLSEDELRDQFVSDCGLAATKFGLPVPQAQEGDWKITGTAAAQLMLQGLRRIALSDTNRSIFTCDAERVEEFATAQQLEVLPEQGATGRIVPQITGTATIARGTELVARDNGAIRYRLTRGYIAIQQGIECEIEATTTGEATNLPAGTKLRFDPAPLNVKEEATVSLSAPLVGGRGTEGTESKRKRVIESFGTKAAGGNWAQVRQIIEATDLAIRCYVYPALGGPGSKLALAIRDFDIAGRSITRRPNAVQLANMAAALQAQLPDDRNTYVWAPNELLANFTVTATLPGVAAGNGWLDASPWPPLVVADAGRVSISSVGANGYSIVVTANTSTAPIAAQTRVSWWSSIDRVFRTSTVLSSTGSAGAWTLTLQTPFVDYSGATPVVGDYVCPASKNIEAYGAAWLALFGKLGPGEATTDVVRLPRAARHPIVSDTDPSNLADLLLFDPDKRFPELTGARLQYAPVTTPTVPATVATAPYILVPRHFGIYRA